MKQQKKKRKSQDGQAMIEFVLLLAMVVLLALIILKASNINIGKFWLKFVKIISDQQELSLR